jgi:REP element-mobilizing transposase RayT
MQNEIEALPPDLQDRERRKQTEDLVEQGHGCCALKDPAMAACIVETWQRFAPERYDLIAFVVMPNHVHILIRVQEGWALGKIVQSWKSFTGKRLIAAHGVGWMREYWDRFIRDERHFAAAVAYIHNNPVKAGLVQCAEDWPWSSAAVGKGSLHTESG